MSNAVFPVLPGLTWSVLKTPEWSTLTQKSTSGKELRLQLYSYPIWRFTLTYEFLRAGASFNELQILLGFYNARAGSFDTFLFDDTSDDSVTAQAFGTGNGSTTVFQLVRTMGSYIEPIRAPNVVQSITINGVPTTGYTLDATTGLVTFSTAPGAGAALAWTGTFYYRVRFAQDTVEFENFMYQLWALKKLDLVSVK